MLFSFVWLALETESSSIDDASKYEQVLKSAYPSNRDVYFFPSKIPQDATEVKFYYRPEFLQGGAENE